MEFLLVPLLFGICLLLLSIGKLFGRAGIKEGCKPGQNLHGVGSCGACSSKDFKPPLDKDDAGLENVAKLGNPNRARCFSAKFDFRPERSN